MPVISPGNLRAVPEASELSSDDLNKLELVIERLEAEYGPDGSQTVVANLKRWFRPETPLLEVSETLDIAVQLDPAAIYDEFWRDLPFGTGGRRGPVGIGPNRINPTTVAMAVQGHAQYLAASGDSEKGVVVANDVREFRDLSGRYAGISPNPLIGISSWSLARQAAQIYAGNGLNVFVAALDGEGAVLTTPELSFAIHELGCLGGVNFSASHNHPDDNGVKVYDERGAQSIPPDDQELMEIMQAVTDVKMVSLEDGVASGKVRSLPAGVHESYLALYSADDGAAESHSGPIVFTPLCGSGDSTVGDALRERGFDVRIPDGQQADGSFEAIPFRTPNPEVAEATVPARRFADSVGADLVLASDPDADRLGVDVRTGDGKWRHINGNQIASILAYYLMGDEAGPQKKGVCISTAVTTRLVPRIAEDSGSATIDDLLVGFKYIGDRLWKLDLGEGEGELAGMTSEDLVLGAEESHGVLIVGSMRDKDATSGAIPLVELYDRLKREGTTLFDYYLKVLEIYGGYAEVARSAVMAGETGTRHITEIMDSVRSSPATEIEGCGPLDEVIDWLDEEQFGPYLSETDRKARNMIQLRYERAIITLRPSGTEPKIKWYVHVLPGPDDPTGLDGAEILSRSQDHASGVAKAVYLDVLDRVGQSLSPAALTLPDIVSVNEKTRFDDEISPWIVDQIRAETQADPDEAAKELAEKAANLTPGADPLPAMREAIGVIAEVVPEESRNKEVLARLGLEA